MYLCECIVGNEDYVKKIRIMNTVHDNLSNGEYNTIITSGSFGEGIPMPGSDIDLMHVLKEYDVFEEAKIQKNRNTAQFLMETEDTKPGFVRLRFLHSNDKSIFELCDEMRFYKYFSNVLFKENFMTDVYSCVHGPCLSDKTGLFDIAYCLHSKSWVKPAQPWLKRSNYSWPGFKVKQNIMKHGVLFVAIGVKGSAYEQIEWRLSFSVGETFLIYTFTHTQCICYSLMKILLKEQIDIDIECKDLLCSYFMKTILFWLSEELPISIWRPENLISCFMRCFRRLIYCVEYSVCPHYFIPENNLFEDKMKGKARETLLHKLKIIYSYGWKFLVFPFEISNTEISFLFEQIQLNQRNTNYVNNSNLQKLLSSNSQCITGYGIASDKLWENGIHMIMSHKSSKIKTMCLYYMSRMITLLETKQVKDIYDNKSKYQEYKTRISTLVQNIYHDSVTGWLKLASFFYKTKQFKIALVIIRYSLLKCTPEKQYPHMKKSGFPHDQLNIRVFRKMNFVKLWKYLLVDYVVLYPDCMLTLEELVFYAFFVITILTMQDFVKNPSYFYKQL